MLKLFYLLNLTCFVFANLQNKNLDSQNTLKSDAIKTGNSTSQNSGQGIDQIIGKLSYEKEFEGNSNHKKNTSDVLSISNQDIIQSSHDGTESSHDRTESSHDRTESSHDRTESSHDRTESSHDRTESSHDRTESSHNRTESSHDRMQSSHENDNGTQITSQNGGNQSRNSNESTDGVVNAKITQLNRILLDYNKIENVPNITFNDGNKMPAISVGTAMMSPVETEAVVSAAIDIGYRSFDSAIIYGNEDSVGKAINSKIESNAVKREELFLTSKLWNTFHSSALVEQECRAIIRRLGVEYLDLLLMHSPMGFKEGGDLIPKIAGVIQYSDVDYLETWFAMEALLEKNLVRSIGVSNFNSQQLGRLVEKGRIIPAVNQVECHPYLNQARLSEFCESHNVRVTCFGALGSTGTPEGFRAPGPSVLADPIVKNIARDLNRTEGQVLIRYQLDRGHGVIVKTTNAKRLFENLSSVNFTLEEKDIKKLDTLNKNRRHITMEGFGDTHKHYPFTCY